MGDGGGRKVQEGGDICIHIADSLCFTAETQHCKAIILQLNIYIYTYTHTHTYIYIYIRAEKYPPLLEKGTTRLNKDIWMNLEDIMLNEISQTQRTNTIQCYLEVESQRV